LLLLHGHGGSSLPLNMLNEGGLVEGLSRVGWASLLLLHLHLLNRLLWLLLVGGCRRMLVLLRLLSLLFRPSHPKNAAYKFLDRATLAGIVC